MAEEEVINYSGYDNSTWWSNKKRGFQNRYFKYKRYFKWYIHTKVNTIEPDYSKLPKDRTPVLINNFNRLDLLQQQIEWLLQLDDPVSIIIVDNLSSYPPLLEYYKNITHPYIQVVYLNFNSWRKGVEYIGKKKLKAFDKFIITDSDLLPYPNTPRNLISYLSDLLDQYPSFNHIGPSLEIKDLPDHNPLKETIVNYESEFWMPRAKCLDDKVVAAKIDTTFAMYRRTSTILLTEPALRTIRPYTLKHVDWYLDPKNHSEEFQYYLKSCKSFATWAHESKREKTKA